MLKIAICDDDPIFLDYLGSKIKQFLPVPHQINAFTDDASLAEYLVPSVAENLDILFLNVDLQGNARTGIALAQDFCAQYPHIKIIFLVEHSEYFSDLFDGVTPTYMLLKPLEEQRLHAALDKSQRELSSTRLPVLIVHNKNGSLRLPTASLRYISSRGRKLSIFDEHSHHEIYARLNDIEPMLPANFLRCHQSHLLNMDFLLSYAYPVAQLIDGTRLPISRSRYHTTKQQFENYVKQQC